VVELETQFEVPLSRAEALAWCRWATEEMRIGGIYDAHDDGFRAGNEWWDSYQLTVLVDSAGDASSVAATGKSLKIGFESRLRRELERFEDLVAGTAEEEPDAGGSPVPPPDDTDAPEVRASERARIAKEILAGPKVALLNFHISGVKDQATALHNMTDTAAGRPAKRSSYGNAPGGSVWLSVEMLRALKTLAQRNKFRLTEIAGASHTVNSRHYRGVAFDCDVLNGRPIDGSHPGFRAFMNRCRQLGATEVLGPGDGGHSTHLHIAW